MSVKHKNKIKNQKYSKKNKHLSAKGVSFWQQRIAPERFYMVLGGFSFIVASLVVALSISVAQIAALVPNIAKSVPQAKLEQAVTTMTKGHPIVDMLPAIFTKDQATVAYLIAIAKKESNWGKIAPKKSGQDCFNYWGFKGHGSRGVAAGHTCFGSREEAVDAVASRIDTLVNDYNRDTPREMVVWKCGYSCAGHSDASVQKWISDVAYYNNKINSATN
jgi:hypothetical protein